MTAFFLKEPILRRFLSKQSDCLLYNSALLVNIKKWILSDLAFLLSSFILFIAVLFLTFLQRSGVEEILNIRQYLPTPYLTFGFTSARDLCRPVDEKYWLTFSAVWYFSFLPGIDLTYCSTWITYHLCAVSLMACLLSCSI